MIRCVRLWTGEDQNSHAEEGFIDLEPGARGDFLSGTLGTSQASFQETRPAAPSNGIPRRSVSS